LGSTYDRRQLRDVSKKALIWIGMTVGSIAGGYLPALWGGDFLSFSGVILSTVGGFLGIWIGYRFGD
jgi:uncharacterized membrane protein YoaK (UPF0700 family)